MKYVKWFSVAAGSVVVGWLICFLSAIAAFRKFQPVDITLTEDDDE